MGVSTDAILAYGYPIADDSVTHEDIERLMQQIDDGEIEWDAVAPEQNDHVEIISHCSEEYRMYFVGIKIERASRGFPRNVTVNEERPQVTRDRVDRFMDKWKLTQPVGGCGYYLFSWWG